MHRHQGSIAVVHVAITMTSQICVSVKRVCKRSPRMAVPSEKSHSQYFQQLDSTAKARYLEKLQILGNIEDPYVRSGVSGTNVEWYNWPNVEFPDIYSYLIAAPEEELNAHKPMDISM